MAAGWGKVWDLSERFSREEGAGLRDEERLAMAAHALAYSPPQHTHAILETWQALRDKTLLCFHGGAPRDEPSVSSWLAGANISSDEGEVWARAPRQFPVLHGFYACHPPGALRTPLDPYLLQTPAQEDQDLHARASEEALREGAIALAALRDSSMVLAAAQPTMSGARAPGAAWAAPGVVWQRFAAAAAQGDAVLLLGVLFASSPHELVAIFQHLFATQLDALQARVTHCSPVGAADVVIMCGVAVCVCVWGCVSGSVCSVCSVRLCICVWVWF